MDKNMMCEAMYALPGGVVVKRRKSQLLAGVLLVAGVALIAVNSLYGANLSNDLRSAAVFIGALLALGGLSVAIVRIFGTRGVPFHTGKQCYLLFEELYFDRSNRPDVMHAIDTGDVSALLAVKRSRVPALTVELYRSPDNAFAAVQAYEYSDLEYHPLTELKIIDKS